MSTTGPPVLINPAIHAAAMAKVEAAGHPVIELAIPVLLTPEELLGRLGPAEAVVCHLTDRVDERVLARPALRGAGPPRGSVTLRTRERLPLRRPGPAAPLRVRRSVG